MQALRSISSFIPKISKMSSRFGSHHAPPLSKLPSATSRYIKINVRNVRGQWREIYALPGESLQDVLWRENVEGVFQDNCNGYQTVFPPHQRPHYYQTEGPSCSSCRVVFIDNWYQKLESQTDGMSPEEQIIMKQKDLGLRPKTRLACCVPIEPWMEGLTVEIDPNPCRSESPFVYV